MDDTAAAGILKTIYPPNASVEKMVWCESRLLDKLAKKQDFSGDSIKVPWIYEDVASGSATFAKAVHADNMESSKNKALTIDIVKKYSKASIDNVTLLRARNNAGAFVDVAKTEVDSAIRRLYQHMAGNLFRGSAGDIGQISSGTDVSTTTLTLAARCDHVNFYEGQRLIFAATRTGARRSATEVQVVSVNREAGSLVLSAAPNTVSGVAGDYVFTSGNEQNGGTALGALGLGDYIPSTAPVSGDSFCGIDRSADTKLSGIRIDGSNCSIEEGLIDVIARGQEMGANADTVVMTPGRVGELIKSLGTKVEYTTYEKAGVGFKLVHVYVGNAMVEVVADRFAGQDTAWVLDTSKFEIKSMLEAPHIWEADELKFVRSGDADAIEFLVSAYYNLICTAPFGQGRLSLPSAGTNV